MTIGEQMRMAGQKIQLEQNGKTVVLTGTYTGQFNALCREESEVDPGFEFGSDPREVTLIEAYRPDVPAALLEARAESQIPCTIDGVSMRITKRLDNPSTPIVVFRAVKVT